MMAIENIDLERIRVGLAGRISLECLREPTVEVYQTITDELMVRVHGLVWGQTLQRQEVQYPADWWQAFKIRWFPRWALRRWPARYEVMILEAKAFYPTCRYDLPTGDRAAIVITPPYSLKDG